MHTTLYYDGSFDGLLSAVFRVYAGKYAPDAVHITHNTQDTDLFSRQETVATSSEHAQRVFKRLERQIGRKGMIKLLYGFLIALPEMPDTFLRLVRLILARPARTDVLSDYGHFDVMQWAKWVKTVGHEKHRMEAFVRFEELSDGLYIARIEPQYDVLPLIVRHFRQRYPQQPWAIFDMQRGYGIFSHSDGLHPINHLEHNRIPSEHAAHERDYQHLWQRYFNSSTILSRRNPNLHRRQMPQRYWKYLTEKQPML